MKASRVSFFAAFNSVEDVQLLSLLNRQLQWFQLLKPVSTPTIKHPLLMVLYYRVSFYAIVYMSPSNGKMTAQ
jgi:hypothetical protein